MTDQLEVLEGMVASVIAVERSVTPERIRELINSLRSIPICSNVDDEAAEHLARRFEERLGVTMTIGAVVTDREFTPWLSDARAGIDPYYWGRYRKLLIGKGFAPDVLATLDDVTDRVLGLLENPLKEGPWDRRGMVVGHVQSGKTANYTGLICKAADAGYKLIVVIAGIHNNLRNQTQLRIDEGFVGRDSARLLTRRDERFVGVGQFDKTRRPVTFTNSIQDFNKTMATGVGITLDSLKEPAIFVIKKNPSTLQRLFEWLKEHSTTLGTQRVDAPMLLIDDEADNASINLQHGKEGVSKINGQIRDVLKMFGRSCYVGYTATPFANIFIDPDSDDEMRGADLFPRNFIVSLDPPSNYFGPNRVFIDRPDAVIRHIDDHAEALPLKHKKDFAVEVLPDSLWCAVRAFVVACAIRSIRGQDRQHCSMLVNVSRFTDVQRQIRNLIHEGMKDLQAALLVNGGLPAEAAIRSPEIAALHSVWVSEYAGVGPEWPEVLAHLHRAAAPITVVEVNSRSAGTLNYADHDASGLNVIAVGGFSLSRGLTLEGLMVSYFLRNSVMYDTLMQMGRWFGYRPGYEDLCRVWMPEEAEGWYAHIAESIEMLREELRRMEAANATPEQFGLKVRSHPDSLMVTARNKMGSGQKLVVSIGLGNSFVETATLLRDSAALNANRAAARAFVEGLQIDEYDPANGTTVAGGRLITGVPAAHVLEFLSRFQNHPGADLTDGDPIRRYIETGLSDRLDVWDVLLASVKEKRDEQPTNILGFPIHPQTRTEGKTINPRTLLISSKQRVASRGVERIGLTAEQIRTAELGYREHLKSEGRTPPGDADPNYPDWIYRSVRERPLLILHALWVQNQEGVRIFDEPVVAWSISFPRPGGDERRVEYVVNTTWIRERYPDEDLGDEMEWDSE